MTGLSKSPGVVATDRDGLAIARIAARKNRLAALTDRIRERFRVDLPQGPRRVVGAEVAFIGVGVETWLAAADTELNGFAASLRQVIDDSASVSDQIGSYALVRLSGPRVRDALAKFVPLDLHARVFDPGSAASTTAAHIPLTLWRLEDGSGGWPIFELAAPRSYAGSFWHTITESAAEFGFTRTAAAATAG
jgi:heterotetrameric sarcosine oxidase gamma subunit